MSTLCPCGSGKNLADCCEPFIEGLAKPPTAEALMRSRYTSYALCNIDYLYNTSGETVRKDFDAESSRTWAQSAEWTGMEIVAVQGGLAQDTTGTVEFIAHYTIKGTPFDHHERSVFEKIDGEWVFIDGTMISPEPIRRESPKIGRNDPCPCGSGKKYKKCCGKDAQD